MNTSLTLIASVAGMLLLSSAAYAQKAEKKVAAKDAAVYRVKLLSESEKAKDKGGLNDLRSIYEDRYNAEDTVSMVSYAYGQGLATNLKLQGFSEVDLAALSLGIIDVMQNHEAKMTETEGQQMLNTYIQQLMEAKAEMAKAEGEAFLAENGKKEGVVTTESGLQYKVLNEGEGDKPSPTSKVTVHYHGTLKDGTVFDSSVERGQPATFGLNQVIPGWTEGLQLMSPGAKYVFYIPSDLGYGPRGAGGGKIGPNEVLVFEVELISMQ